MGLQAKCHNCGVPIILNEAWLGKRAKCPTCGSEFRFSSQVLELPSPPKPQPPVFIIQPAPPAVEPIPTRLIHDHKISGGGFRFGFGLAIGCMFAMGLMFGGCVFMAALMKPAMDASVRQTQQEVAEEQAREMERIRREMEEEQRPLMERLRFRSKN